jgi:hypothetical protein
LRAFTIVVSRVHLPPGWTKFWWYADCIQYGNPRKVQKNTPRFFSERIHAPADSFISKNEGMNETGGSNACLCIELNGCPTFLSENDE